MSKARLFDPEALEVLTTLAETRSFTKTAKLLARSQSTVSASIQRLEERTGCKLVSRTTRSVLLTGDGEELVRYARTISELSDRAMLRLSQPAHSETVRLGVFTNFDGMALSTALREFSRVNPSVQVRIETHRSDILLSLFRDGMLDVVLATRQKGHGLGTPLCEDELVWVGPADMSDDVHEPVPLAVRVKPSMMRRMGVEALNVARRSHVIAFEGNSYPGIAAAVSAGLGISVFTRHIRPPFLPVIVNRHLPTIGSIDFVLIRSDGRRREVEALYGILREQWPNILASAADAMFGSVVPFAAEAHPAASGRADRPARS